MNIDKFSMRHTLRKHSMLISGAKYFRNF